MRRFNFRAPEFLALLNSTSGIVRLADLDHLWNMDEASSSDGAVDSGSGPDLSAIGSPGTTTGKINGARSCGPSNYFQVNLFDPVPGDVTVFFWTQFLPEDNYMLVCGADPDVTPSAHFGFLRDGSKLKFVTGDSGLVFDFAQASGDFISGWNFIAGGWDSASGKIWAKLNGAARVEATPSSWRTIPENEIMVGKYDDGDFDQVGLKYGVLTDEQLDWIYNSGLGRPIV